MNRLARGAKLIGLALVPAVASSQPNSYSVTIEGREQTLILPKILPECEAASGHAEEIVICGRRDNESERYRLPRQKWNPNGPVASVSRERHSLYEQGDSGIGSCSTVGPGGWTGCALRTWKANREQHGR